MTALASRRTLTLSRMSGRLLLRRSSSVNCRMRFHRLVWLWEDPGPGCEVVSPGGAGATGRGGEVGVREAVPRVDAVGDFVVDPDEGAAGGPVHQRAGLPTELQFPAFDASIEDGRGAGNGSRTAGPMSCAKYGLEVPVGGGAQHQ